MLNLFNYVNVITATTTTIPASVLGRILINTSAAGTITIYDNSTASGNKIGTIAASATGSFPYDCGLKSGYVTVVTAAAGDVTILSR